MEINPYTPNEPEDQFVSLDIQELGNGKLKVTNMTAEMIIDDHLMVNTEDWI